MDWPYIDLRSIFKLRPTCGECKKSHKRVAMEPDECWSHQQASYMTCWRCPECDHKVLRSVGDEGPQHVDRHGYADEAEWTEIDRPRRGRR